MPRRKIVRRKKVVVDPKFKDALVARCITTIMRRGKKSLAERVLYGAFDLVSEKTNENPLEMFHKAIENVKPQVEVKSRRVGGSTYQVPVEIRAERRTALALRWLIKYSSARSERTMWERLGGEIVDAASNRGAAVKKRDDTHKMAEANKAFQHYRW